MVDVCVWVNFGESARVVVNQFNVRMRAVINKLPFVLSPLIRPKTSLIINDDDYRADLNDNLKVINLDGERKLFFSSPSQTPSKSA